MKPPWESEIPFSYIDISPEVSSSTAVYPGDTEFKRDLLMSFAKGDHLELSSFTTTSHIGAHADAPSHYHPLGKAISERSLHYYLGFCQVIQVRLDPNECIQARHFDILTVSTPRVLFKTLSFSDPNGWKPDFNAVSPEVIELLAQRKVCLIGIDTPSIDPADSKSLDAHQAIYRNDLAILEGLTLSSVSEGIYFLVALPLKIKSGEASPVRAILIELDL